MEDKEYVTVAWKDLTPNVLAKGFESVWIEDALKPNPAIRFFQRCKNDFVFEGTATLNDTINISEDLFDTIERDSEQPHKKFKTLGELINLVEENDSYDNILVSSLDYFYAIRIVIKKYRSEQYGKIF